MKGAAGAAFITTRLYASPPTASWSPKEPVFPPRPGSAHCAYPSPSRRRNSARAAPPIRAERHNPTAIATLRAAVARERFLEHVRVHSPDKPRTLARYAIVLEHFERHLGGRRFVEAVSRTDIDDYKAARSRERSQQHPGRIITPRTINFEISVLRTFFYFLINERGVKTTNPCARFKPLRDAREKARRRPPTYSEAELECLFAACGEFERAVFAMFLLTGMREQELCFLAWPDMKLRAGRASVKVSGEGKEGFSPKDYEERVIPIPDELAAMLRELPRDSRWVFSTAKGGRQTHLLRRLKEIAGTAEVDHATLHKFRRTSISWKLDMSLESGQESTPAHPDDVEQRF